MPEATQPQAHQWTKPFHGLQHYIQRGSYARWATVEDMKSFAMMRGWFEGCGFTPRQSRHDSVEDARAAAEAFVNECRRK